MNREEIKTYFENLAQDSNLEITDKVIIKFVNLSLELAQDEVCDVEEIRNEFLTIAPDNSDEWADFIDEASSYLVDEILDEECENEEETE